METREEIGPQESLWISAAAEGDLEAFNALALRHKDPICAFVGTTRSKSEPQ